MSSCRRFLLPIVVLLSIRVPAWAQTHSGSVRGRVRDAAGPVSAPVELTDENTGLIRKTVSTRQGEYEFADVVPGDYRIDAALPGYRAYRWTGLRVSTQEVVTVDVVLEPGEITEQVVVTAAAAVVDVSDASVSTLIDRSALDSRPSAGRNVFFSATEAATVLPSGDSRFVRQQDQSGSSLISVAGGPRRDNSYVLDGVPIVDVLNRATFIPTFHAVEQIRVQASDYDAETGRTSGGVFNVVARSGSNDWRGDAMYQGRPVQSQSFFAARSDLPEPGTYYHLYGGSVGGPIVRNRTFFWASSEGYRSSTTRSAVMVLPTEAERRGDFSQAGVTIYDPLTTRIDPVAPARFVRDPFPNNQIPGSRLNPVSLALLQYLPLPVSGNERPAVASLVDAADQATAKITHRWSDRFLTTGLYAWYESTEPDARFFGQPLFADAADPGDGALVRRVHMIALNGMWTPGDRTLVQLRAGFNQFLDDNRPAAFDPSGLGFASAFLAAAPQLTFPSIGVVGYGGGNGFLGDRFQSTATYYSHDANVAVAHLAGRHAMKFGGDARVTGVRFANSGGMGGYSFDGRFTYGPDPNAPAAGTGDAFASFLLGYPSSGGISINAPIDVYLNYWSGFAQDDVRVTPRLTVTLGLRYEFEQGLEERHDQMVTGWSFDAPFPVQVAGTRPDGTPLALTGGVLYAGDAGAPTHQGNPSAKQFGPRLGAAYALGDRAVLRAGYGLYWAPMQGISADEFGSGTPGYNQSTSYVPTGADPLAPCGTCSLTNPFPSGIAQPAGSAAGRLTNVGGTIEFVDPRSHLAHFHRYSIDVQRELPGRIAVDVGYLGMLGRDLTGGINAPLDINQLDPKYASLGSALQRPVANPFAGTALATGILSGPTVALGQLLRPYPQFDTVYMTRASLSRSRYDAVVVTAERRLARRWSAQVNYTWSRALDSQFAESNFFAGGSAILDNYDVDAEYGPSVLDTPHRLNVATTVELPFGLSVSAVGSYQSGFPITVDQAANNSNLLGSAQRPNLVPGVNPQLTSDPASSYDATCGCIRWLNPAAWSQAPPFTFGNAPRTDVRVRTPARRNWDLAIQKSRRVAGRTISARAEIINVFNAVDFLGPDIAFGSATFGQIRSSAGFPRTLQLSVQAAW